MDKPKPPSSRPDKDARSWLAYSGMAFEMFGIIAVFAALGYFLDKKLNTSPILVLVLLFAGVAAAFYRIFKQLSQK